MTMPFNGNNIMFKQLAVAGLIALCSASLGFGVSQATLISEVHHNRDAIEFQKTMNEQIRKEISDERGYSSARYTDLSNLIGKSIEMDQQLIELVRIQNELLRQKK